MVKAPWTSESVSSIETRLWWVVWFAKLSYSHRA